MKILISALLICFSAAFSQEPSLESSLESSLEPSLESSQEPENSLNEQSILDNSSDNSLDNSSEPENLSYKEATKVTQSSNDGEPLIGWRGWTRIIVFAGAIVCGTGALFKNTDAAKNKDVINALDRRARDLNIYDMAPAEPERKDWQREWASQKNQLIDNENDRNILGIAAGVFATAGIVTFFF